MKPVPSRGRTLLFAYLLALLPAGMTPVTVSLEVMSPGEVDSFIAPLFEDETVPRAEYSVTIRELVVSSRYPDGTPTDVRVQLFLPDMPAGDVRGVYLFAPGSTGLIGPCRASREHVAGIRWGLYRAHVLAFAGQGLIGILPDYIGFEDAHQVQPYFHAESEARIIFDSIHHIHKVLEAGGEHFPLGLAPYTRVAGGFSQGGHAVFAAADHNRFFGGEMPLHGVIGYGATTEIPPLFLTFPPLAPMILEAYRTIYGEERFDPRKILRTEWAETLTYDTTRQCVGGIQNYYPGDPALLFRESFLTSLRAGTLDRTHPSIAAIFHENATGLTRHGVPALILQGSDDIVVFPATQKEFVRELRARGNPVDYRLYENTRHDTRQRSFVDVLEWIDRLPGNSAR
ncbi:MAG: hypothetical protein EA427_01160 [Spirochaetaceae bacterium]|nr:MAG: hypothetical protein EA427_01160 [Spirochaetaceae bacterium]